MNVKKNEEELISVLHTDGKKGILLLYQCYKRNFLSFARRFSSDQELLVEAYHEGVLGFYDMFLANKYDAARGQIKTLVFQIGKNHLINRLNRENREKNKIDNMPVGHSEEEVDFVSSAKRLMGSLGDKCRELLTLFYYHNYAIEAIMHRMEYKNENVVKSHKSRCLKQLRKSMQPKQMGNERR